jgi:hypothetical protein
MTQPTPLSLAPAGRLPKARSHVDLPCDAQQSRQQDHTDLNLVLHPSHRTTGIIRKFEPNVVVEWLTLLRIREVPVSIIIAGTDDRISLVFSGFPQSFQGNAEIVPLQNYATTTSYQILSDSS